jgi:hypothetical protein
MAIVELPATPAGAALDGDSGLDLQRFRLRRFVESLTEVGELQVVDEPVDLADVAEVFDGNDKAVLLRRLRTAPRI